MPSRNVKDRPGKRPAAWAALLLLPLPIAESAAQEDEVIDEIQVTASRRPLAATKVSAALTVVPSDEIANEKLLTDALAGEVGVFLQQTTAGQGAAIIRGLKGSEILHIVDGLRLNNAIFRNAPTQYLALVPPGSVERMEIVRGSPTSLYGSDAVGGVIQVISRLPHFDGDDLEFRREFAVGADSAELGKSARVSVDAGNRRLAGLVSAGYQEAGNRRTGAGGRIAPSGFEAYGGRAAVVARPADDRSFVLDLQFMRQPSTPRVDELVPGFGQAEASSSEFFFEPNERWFLHARHTREDGWLGLDWTADIGWQRIVDDRRTRDSGATSRRFEENESDLVGLSVVAAREIGEVSWVFGGEFYHDTVSSARWEQDVAGGARTDRQSRFPDGAVLTQAGLFAHASLPLGERHTLSGGLRGSAVAIELPATTISPAADIDIEDVSADLGWLYDIDAATQLAANVGLGFRAPNIFDLGTLGDRPGNRFNIPNPALESEHVTQVDLALRRRQADLTAEIVVFRLEYTDRIQSALTGDTAADGRDVVQSRNLGRAEIYGVEAGLRWQPEGPLSAALVVNHTRGEQREEDGSLGDGDRIPPLNGRLTIAWDIDAAWALESSLVFADRQDRLSPRDVRDVRIDPNGTPGWGVANIGLSWKPSEAMTVDAGVDNVFDRRYRSHGSGIDAPGRNLYLFARMSW